MNNEQGQGTAQDPQDSVGPTEKLRQREPLNSDTAVPGAQKPENEEIKEESNPNTE